ncbi:MAG: trigger factor [Kiritimatiellaeota bacterium]|nr:trigger factor [Kiritimatiellota bacterium]
MKVDKLDMGSCRVKATVRADAEETRPEYDTVVRYFVQKGRIPGFRAGKVPLDVVKRTFANEIREEVNTRLLRSLYAKTVEQEKFKVVNLVNIEDVRFSPETGMTVAFVIDVEPKVVLPDYKKIPVKFTVPEVPDAEVEDNIQRIREAYAKFAEAGETDYPIQRGDLVSLDFEGTINGQPIKEIVPEAATIAEGVAHWTQVNDEYFLPQLVAELIGMKAGESKTATFTFEGAYLPDGLRGQPAVYTLTVKEVRCRILRTDEELVRELKVESMEAFRALTRKSLAARAEQQATLKLESEVIAFLLGKNEFDVPQSQLDEEINETLHRMADDAGRRGMTKEDLEKHRAEIVENATATAKRQLRIRYLLAAVGDQENVEATDEDVSQWIEAAAPSHRLTPIQLRARIEKNRRMDDLRWQVRNNKVLKLLVQTLK